MSDYSDDDFVMSDEENVRAVGNVPAKAARGKSAASKKPAASFADSDSEIDAFDDSPLPSKSKAKGGSNRRTSMERVALSNKYQKKTQYEHIMLRPDTYIGSTERIKTGMWVFEDGRMTFRTIGYVPGLYKIFDEILVNASDNKQRDPNMKGIKVTIDAESGSISVWNDGRGIPIEVHAEHHVYIPELVFGHLMTGENFEDTEKRVVGGRNGYGAKLANIFSSHFSVETNDTKSGKRYFQEWSANMSVKGEPKIKSASGKDFTKVTFTPDYARFGMPNGLDRDTVALLTKRVYDVAGITHKSVKVTLNGEAIKANSFDKYIDLYLAQDDAESNQGGEEDDSFVADDDDDDEDFDGEKKKSKAKGKKAAKAPGLTKVYERINDRWEVCIAASQDGQMQQVSFVNGICTMKGGQHVNFIADQVVTKLQALLKKKHKGIDLKPHQVKGHLWIFVNALIVNPAFDSQTKETLTTRSSKFGPTEFLPKLSDKALKSIERTPIVSNVMYWAKAKEMRDLSNKVGGTKKSKIKGVDKLDDANNAGGRNSSRCTLILTEGDSAKTLAISGLSVVGRDDYGVFPLRGKLLNVREAPAKQIIKNEEIQNIMKIMGLQPGKKYTDTKGLRYGHLMIMTDQDHDGSHIKGLLMNFIHHFWPSLLEVPNFLQVFITPIVKATKSGSVKAFYTMPEYESWVEALTVSERRHWKIKYYKGLGTSTATEAKEYFADIDHHRINMEWEGDEAGDVLELAFSKKRVNDRKDWLSGFEPGTHMDFDVSSIQYSDFVNKELILFSMADNTRSIPSVIDGLKPSQRKVLFSCFKRNLKGDIKVAQLVGYASEHSAYHHGEVSLASTIVGMAQCFVGSNNINLLFPSGQFGSRIMGGKDAASSRYIFTRLAMLTRQVFHQSDDAILNYLNDDGQNIEPDFYVPVIPFLLVNGSSGIGTGWSTDVPCFNPRQIISHLRRKLINCEPETRLQPWYKGFQGTIEPEIHNTKGFTGRYKLCGIFERDDDEQSIIITELPVGTWTQSYKQFLMDDKAFPDGFIKDVQAFHTDTRVHFVVYLSPEAYRSVADDAKLIKKFRLESTVNTTNMHAFNSQGMIQKYAEPEDILDEFFGVRLEVYAKRKKHIETQLEEEWKKLDNKARFIQMVIDDKIVVTKRKKQDLLLELEGHGFDKFFKSSKAKKVAIAGATEQDEDDDSREGAAAAANDSEQVANLARGYDYLLSMAIWTLTAEKVAELNSKRDDKRRELDVLLGKRPHDLWEEDLDALEAALDLQDELDREAEALEESQRGKARKGGRVRKAPAKPRTIKPKAEPLPLPAPSRAAPAVKAERPVPVASKPKPKMVQRVKEEDDEDEFEITSLSERLKTRMLVSPAPTKRTKKRSKEATPVLAKVASKIGRSKVLDDSSGEESELETSAVAQTPPPKPSDKRRRLKTDQKAPRPVAEEQGESPAEAAAKPAPKRAAAKTKAKKPAKKVVESSDESDASEEGSDEEVLAAPAVARPRRQRAAAPKVPAYVEISDSEEDNIDEDAEVSEFDGDGSDSDF